MIGEILLVVDLIQPLDQLKLLVRSHPPQVLALLDIEILNQVDPRMSVRVHVE